MVRSIYLTAFDMTVALRSSCSDIPPTRSQTWSEGRPTSLLPVVCRQLYEETSGLLYALNTFAFTDGLSMRVWISCRTPTQRQQIRSLKLPSSTAGYYKSPHNVSLVAIFPQLQTIYIDIWRIVERENKVGGIEQVDITHLSMVEQTKVRAKEENKVAVLTTECVYTSTVFGWLLRAA